MQKISRQDCSTLCVDIRQSCLRESEKRDATDTKDKGQLFGNLRDFFFKACRRLRVENWIGRLAPVQGKDKRFLHLKEVN